jgi:Cys-tRNA synthase (O-phospho-L-seryl-tRNA:Cys-tRNA synthase)
MPTLERGMGLQSRAKHKIDFMVIGGSHAARTAKLLIETGTGYSVCKLINTGLRIDRASCEALASTVSTSLNEEDPDVVVL